MENNTGNLKFGLRLLHTLFKYGGSMTLRELQALPVEGPNRKPLPWWENLVQQFDGKIFRVEERENSLGKIDLIVYAYTELELCEDHWTKHGCLETSGCPKLHLCKFFIITKCGNTRCKFGHNFQSPGNLKVLKDHSLDNLMLDGLKMLLRQNRSKSTLPPICSYYNVGNGCEKGKKCPALHICKHFILGDCTYGQKCKRFHDINQPQPKHLLTQYGLDVRHQPQEVLQLLVDKLGDSQSDEEESSDSVEEEEEEEEEDSDLDDDYQSSGSPSSGSPPSNQNRKSSNRKHHQQRVKESTRPRRSSNSLSKEDQNSDTKEKICTFNLRGRCEYGDSCRLQHCEMPYQWQYLVLSQTPSTPPTWMEFPQQNNEQIESKFCQPALDRCTIELQDQSVHVDFVTMTAQWLVDTLGVREVRRLSTMSSVKGASRFIFTTKWLWYWQLDLREPWTLYEDKGSARNTSLCDDIEQTYLKNPEGKGRVQSCDSDYQLDFSAMVEQADVMMFGSDKTIKRRPVFLSYEGAKELKEGKTKRGPRKISGVEELKEGKTKRGPRKISGVEDVDIPDHWDHSVVLDQIKYSFVQISKSDDNEDDEYSKMKSLFHETMSSDKYSIKAIKRIQNKELWDRYSRKKMWREHELSSDELSRKEDYEKFLFYGTSYQNMAKVCQNGFDWRLFPDGACGAPWGKGNYFYRRAKAVKSHTDSRQLFIARCWVGEYTQGGPEMVLPPGKDDNGGQLYDSCVDKIDNPEVYVVFQPEQAYPEYIIHYAKLP